MKVLINTVYSEVSSLGFLDDSDLMVDPNFLQASRAPEEKGIEANGDSVVKNKTLFIKDFIIFDNERKGDFDSDLGCFLQNINYFHFSCFSFSPKYLQIWMFFRKIKVSM